MGVTITQVDAFTSQLFAGNPAAVCLLPEPADETWMQHLALEMNLSETAFLTRLSSDRFALRWFTPVVEVDLCGHATLASAHVLWDEGHVAPDVPLRFETQSGVLGAERRDDWIELDFPAEPDEPVLPPAGLIEALHVDARYVGRNRFDCLVEVDTEATVRAVAPDFSRLREVDVRGTIVTSPADTDGFDFVSRFFAPTAGIDEDSVTGSAHCCLGPFWQRRLGRTEFTAYQASRRGGVVRIKLADDRVRLSGQAVTGFRAALTRP